MSGETDLDILLSSLDAELADELFVFVTLQPSISMDETITPIMRFEEAQGTTLIVTHDQAVKFGLAFEFPCRMITLNIHSSLEAVGFIAHIATELAGHGMGVNPVSGFYHDHLFVPDGKEEEAMSILKSIASKAKKND